MMSYVSSASDTFAIHLLVQSSGEMHVNAVPAECCCQKFCRKKIGNLLVVTGN